MSKKHTVRQGECLSRIASKYGFSDWRKLYDHPSNAPLRKKRPNPNILFPGDIIVIPDPDKKEELVPTGQRHRFQLKDLRKELRIVFKTPKGDAYDNEPYIIKFEGGRQKDGKTSAAGLLKERVYDHEDSAILAIDGRTLKLRLGYLNPSGDIEHDEISGIQARLTNLGYTSGPIDNIFGRNTRSGIALFQADENLDVTGLPDESTLARLEQVHGC